MAEAFLREPRRYTSHLKRVNVVALAANLGFVGLHAVQTIVGAETALTLDGLVDLAERHAGPSARLV